MKYTVMALSNIDENAEYIDETNNYQRAVISAMASTNTHHGIILINNDSGEIEHF